jgi:hypothetical protein
MKLFRLHLFVEYKTAKWRPRIIFILSKVAFMWPCIVTNFPIIKPTRFTNFSNFILEMKLYMFRAVPLCIISSYSLYTQQWYMSCGTHTSIRYSSFSHTRVNMGQHGHCIHSHCLATEMWTTMKNNLLGKKFLSCSFSLYRFRKYVSNGFSIINFCNPGLHFETPCICRV